MNSLIEVTVVLSGGTRTHPNNKNVLWNRSWLVMNCHTWLPSDSQNLCFYICIQLCRTTVQPLGLLVQSVLPIHRWFDCFQQQGVLGLCERDLPLPTNCWKSQHIWWPGKLPRLNLHYKEQQSTLHQAMTNVMILISTLSIFHSFRAISHLALPMVFIFCSW